MSFRSIHLYAAACFGLALSVAGVSPVSAQALSAKDCGAKYQAAKAAGSLNGQNYFAFRREQCSAAASAQPAAQPAAAGAQTAQANPLRPTPATRAAPAAQAATGNAVFPRAVDAKYSSLRPAQARLKTCSDQYNANKASNANGGMKWIEKGGGYWSACNKAIKG